MRRIVTGPSQVGPTRISKTITLELHAMLVMERLFARLQAEDEEMRDRVATWSASKFRPRASGRHDGGMGSEGARENATVETPVPKGGA